MRCARKYGGRTGAPHELLAGSRPPRLLHRPERATGEKVRDRRGEAEREKFWQFVNTKDFFNMEKMLRTGFTQIDCQQESKQEEGREREEADARTAATQWR